MTRIVLLRLEKKVKRDNKYAIVLVKKDGNLSNFRLGNRDVERTLERAEERKESLEKLNPGSRYEIVEIHPSSFYN